MNPEPLINDLIKENADYTIRDYLDMMAEINAVLEMMEVEDKIIENSKTISNESAVPTCL